MKGKNPNLESGKTKYRRRKAKWQSWTELRDGPARNESEYDARDEKKD